jgi:hypothetical protein
MDVEELNQIKMKPGLKAEIMEFGMNIANDPNNLARYVRRFPDVVKLIRHEAEMAGTARYPVGY